MAAAAARGWPVVTFPASRLAAVPVPNPSEVVRRAVGTPSVAEAAALSGTADVVLSLINHETGALAPAAGTMPPSALIDWEADCASSVPDVTDSCLGRARLCP